MKNIIKNLFAISICFILTSCSFVSNNLSSSTTTNSNTSIINPSTSNNASSSILNSSSEVKEEDENVSLIQNGLTLHAFNWSMKNIKANVKSIVDAGYRSVQISPMQPQKDYYKDGYWKNQWWKLYQPLGFSVAKEKHSLGTKDDLRDLCLEANKYGLKVIVDIVSNHLAGGSSEAFHKDVKTYEREIYEQNLFHQGIGSVNDNTIKQVVQGHLGGFPDLKTESKIVQERVLSLLKEYIDLGVSGFRFDAAKHIETPSDLDYASDFWPYILDNARDYCLETRSFVPYYYGEILHTVGRNREFSYYTDMMSVTDSEASKRILNSVLNNNSDKLNKDNILSEGLSSKKVVLWAESHDTYSNDNKETTNVSVKDINKAYAITSSLKDVSNLYFARPKNGAKLGDVSTDDYKSKTVCEINKFHNLFIRGELNLHEEEKLYVADYQKDGKNGTIIVNLGANGSYSIKNSLLDNGTYVDHISGNVFTCNDGLLTGSNNNEDIVILYKEDINLFKPTLSINPDLSKNLYLGDKIEIIGNYANKGTYKLNDDVVSFDGLKADVILNKLGANTLEVEISNDKYKTSSSYTFIVIEKPNVTPVKGEIAMFNIDLSEVKDRLLYAWAWGSNSGRFIKVDESNNVYRFKIKSGDTHFLLATFDKDININNLNWNNVKRQTNDIEIKDQLVFDASSFTWRNK